MTCKYISAGIFPLAFLLSGPLNVAIFAQVLAYCVLCCSTHSSPLQDCLAALPCRTSFITLVADYSISLKGQFAPPMWNGRELDLYSVRGRGCTKSCCRGAGRI